MVICFSLYNGHSLEKGGKMFEKFYEKIKLVLIYSQKEKFNYYTNIVGTYTKKQSI